MKYNELTEFKWYAIGFKDEDGVIQYGPIYKYLGKSEISDTQFWEDEYCSMVEGLWDPFLQCYVAMDAADDYQEQS